MNPPFHIFQSFWWGEALSPYEVFCLKSFVGCGFGYDLYSYSRDLHVPAGVQLRDAAEILPEDSFFVSKEGLGAGSPAAFTDLFRYKLLVDRGGWWCDTDVVCLSKNISVLDEFFAYQDRSHIAGGLLYFPRGDPVMSKCFDEAKKAGREVQWATIGPLLLTRILEEFGYANRAMPPQVCYPIHYRQFFDILRPSQTSKLVSITKSSSFLHLWNALIRDAGIQKNRLPPKKSFLRGLIEQYQIDGWIGEYEEFEVEQLFAAYRPPWQVS